MGAVGRVEFAVRCELLQCILTQHLQQLKAWLARHARVLKDQAGVDEMGHRLKALELRGIVARTDGGCSLQRAATHEDTEPSKPRLFDRL